LSIVILDEATFGEVGIQPILDLDEPCRSFPITPPEAILARLRGAEIAVSNKVRIDRETMENTPNLELICVAATGTNNVDLEAAKALGIAVTNVPGYAAPSAVSHTFAMYFHLAHHNAYHQEYTGSSRWCSSPTFTHLGQPYSELAGQTWGIIGMGAIGRSVADVARSFGCEVIYHSTSGRNTEQPYPHRRLDELLGTADVVSIHCPLDERTRNLIHHGKLLKMKPNAILINTSRGGIVHEGDLAVALDLGVIAGAALDVMATEPPERDHPFWQLQHPERLFVTPHIAGLSSQARQRLVAEVAANIQAFRRGESRHRLV